MNEKKRVHFIGIGGYGMSAIALVLLNQGHTITGSDISSNLFIEKLKSLGAEIFLSHEPENVSEVELVVYSSSICDSNVEILEAKRLGIKTIHRSQMLAQILNNKQGIAVAGAHGKTTTSSMIAQTLEMCGVDPTYIIGGEICALKSNAKAGKSEYVVAEADESDGTFLEYYPYLAVVTNIEADHLENYGFSFDELKNAYKKFLNQVKSDGYMILCTDDEILKEFSVDYNKSDKCLTYGLNSEADYVAVNIEKKGFSSSFEVKHHNTILGKIEIKIPGLHNISNALACVVVCLSLGVTFDDIKKALALFQGAKRRFQIIYEENDIVIADDYAHHPTEIKSTLQGLESLGKRIVVVFQPQRYSRTHLLMDEFSKSFSLADEVILNTLYAPLGEMPIEGVSAQSLTDLIKVNSNNNVKFIDSQDEIVSHLVENIQPGDLILTMGAGNIWRVGVDLSTKLKN